MPIQARRILGIDTGTAIVGWAIIEVQTNLRLKVIGYGDIRTPAKTRIEKRLHMIFKALQTLISQYNPTEMAVEDLFSERNVTTVISVSEARGVILLSGEVNNVQVFSYTPLQVKVAATGYGQAEKKQVQKMVAKILNLKEIPKVDDAADALAIALCHANSDINQLIKN